MKFCFPFAVAGLLCAGALASAQPGAAPAPPPEEFIEFTEVQTIVNCGDLGGAASWQAYDSPEATIVVKASSGLRVDYLTGADLKNEQGSLPTVFQFSLSGVGTFDGDVFDGRNYSNYFNRDPGQQGRIIFASASPDFSKGLKARIVAQRRGLNDPAGKYQTEVLLRWYKF
jgi:hypothetical protein